MYAPAGEAKVGKGRKGRAKGAKGGAKKQPAGWDDEEDYTDL